MRRGPDVMMRENQRFAPDHYHRFSFLPDESEPVDRWFQVPDGRTVREVGHLISLARDLAPSAELVVDPLCGAGSAAVAARCEDMAFRGFEVYPPRALFALTKCRPYDIGAWKRLLETAGPDPDAADLRRAAAEWTSPDRSVLTLATACLVAESELPSGPSFGDRLRWITEDLAGGPAATDLDVTCLSIREEHGDAPPDPRPAILLTSPPHPRTRGTFKDHGDPDLVDSVHELRRTGRYLASESRPADISGLVPTMFSFVERRYPGVRVAIIEFEDPPGYPSGSTAIIQAAVERGYEVVEVLITYQAAPDGQHPGSGGLVFLRRP
ncbi:hypothetical protein [Longispora urticae]